jgi:hypothetical protein
MAVRRFKKGNKVLTGYGEGIVVQTRPEDGVCVVKLSFGTIFVSPAVHLMRKTMTNEEINASFEAYENMRKMNWEVECNEMGVPCDHTKCQQCVRENAQKERLGSNKSSSSFFSSINVVSNPFQSKKKVDPCLLCASPACIPDHSSKSFAKDKITLCLNCEALFHYETIYKELANATTVRQRLEKLVEAYDRAFLVLRYSSQFIPTLVEQLHKEASHDDKVTLGTSSVGFLSGAMGFAGAATLLTPAGPPLLMASLVFGTGNAAVGMGYNTRRYWQNVQSASPTQVANRLLTLYGFLQAAMEIIVTLQEKLQADPAFDNCSPKKDASSGNPRNAYLEALSKSVEATKRTNTTLRVTNAAGYTASSSVFEMMGATPVIGQAFSAAMLVLDYQTATATLQQIRSGSVHEKAKVLQQNCDWSALSKLPSTTELEEEVNDIMQVVSTNRPQHGIIATPTSQ